MKFAINQNSWLNCIMKTTQSIIKNKKKTSKYQRNNLITFPFQGVVSDMLALLAEGLLLQLLKGPELPSLILLVYS